MMISERPEATASSTTYWMIGLSTSGSISFGCALVAGRNLVPRPAAGKTALRTMEGTQNRSREFVRWASVSRLQLRLSYLQAIAAEPLLIKAIVNPGFFDLQ